MEVITSDAAWESEYDSNGNVISGSTLVEAPWIVYNEKSKYYYLFYSATDTNSVTYDIGVGRSNSSIYSSDYEKFDGSILHTRWGSPYVRNLNDIKWAGPGHCSVLEIEESGQWIIMYHAWNWTNGKEYDGNRYLMDLIEWGDDKWSRIKNNKYYDVPSETYTDSPQLG